MKFNQKSLIYSLTIIVISSIFINVNAQENMILNEENNQVVSPVSENENKPLNFVARGKNDSAPGRRKKGTDFSGFDKKNRCISNIKNSDLIAVAYGEKIIEKSGIIKDQYLLNFTAQEKPSFWFYIPYKSQDKNPPLIGKLRLINEEGDLIAEQNYTLSEKTGIQEILFPANSPSLEIDKTYNVEFSIICNSEDNTDNPFVLGKVTRIRPNPNLIPPKNANSVEKAKFYAENGLWNETITTIIKDIYPLNPQQGQLLLNQLLKSAQLEEILDQEIVH